jgi:hypothetical protein
MASLIRSETVNSMIFKSGVSLSHHKRPFLVAFTYFVLLISYRTLSIHVEQGQRPKSKMDPATAIRQIDVHTLPVDDVYTRFSTSPTLGLESPAVTRLSNLHGKNTISPPKTQHWKKILNYIFGGFNFLMWIAFILTIVCLSPFHSSSNPPPPLPAFVQTTWRSGSCGIQSRSCCTSGSYHITSNIATTLTCR